MIELIAILISIFAQSSADGRPGSSGDGHSSDTGEGATGNG
jgi:hypothetical protein